MMSRYGYLDMPDGYTDIGEHPVTATCPDCETAFTIAREACWIEDDRLMCTCGCTELPDDWVQQEVDQLETKLLWGRSGIELWRSDAPYGRTFVVLAPDYKGIFHNGAMVIKAVMILRAKHGV